MTSPASARRTRPSTTLETNTLLKRQMASISSTLLNASKRRDIALKEKGSVFKGPEPLASSKVKSTVVEILKGAEMDGVWKGREEGEADSVKVIEKDRDKSEGDIEGGIKVCKADGVKVGVVEGDTVKNKAAENKRVGSAAAQPADELQAMLNQLKNGGHETLVNKDPTLHTHSSAPIRSELKGNIHLADLKTMLQELSESSTSFDIGTKSVDESGDLESFHQELDLLIASEIKQIAPTESVALDRLSSHSVESLVSMNTEVSKDTDQERGSIDKIPSALLKYIILLQLEQAACPWKEVTDWTAQLFRNDHTDNPVEQHRDNLSGQTAAESPSAAERPHEPIGPKTIPHPYEFTSKTRQDQSTHHKKEEQADLLHRVLVNNVAAGADAEDIFRLFYRYKNDIEYIELLEERDPKSRTQTAVLYMYSKHAATMASKLYGCIFGLVVEPRLAMETEL